MILRNASDLSHAQVLVGSMAISALDKLITLGIPIYARTFESPSGEQVSVFWMLDPDQHVSSVWEHTYTPPMAQMIKNYAPAV